MIRQCSWLFKVGQAGLRQLRSGNSRSSGSTSAFPSTWVSCTVSQHCSLNGLKCLQVIFLATRPELLQSLKVHSTGTCPAGNDAHQSLVTWATTVMVNHSFLSADCLPQLKTGIENCPLPPRTGRFTFLHQSYGDTPALCIASIVGVALDVIITCASAPTSCFL